MKEYMESQVEPLLEEYQAYPSLFDPDDYTKVHRVLSPVSREKALQRIQMFQSPFQGWSTYSVDGVFFGKNKEVYEEAVQVVRIMFRFASSFAHTAEEAGCSDVLRCILVWLMSRQGRIAGHKMWFESEKRLFLKNQPPFPKRKHDFVERYFTDIAREVNRWLDDRGLFTFAYLVHKFAENVLAEQLYEQEIWVTNLFNHNLIVASRIENGATRI